MNHNQLKMKALSRKDVREEYELLKKDPDIKITEERLREIDKGKE